MEAAAEDVEDRFEFGFAIFPFGLEQLIEDLDGAAADAAVGAEEVHVHLAGVSAEKAAGDASSGCVAFCFVEHCHFSREGIREGDAGVGGDNDVGSGLRR